MRVSFAEAARGQTGASITPAMAFHSGARLPAAGSELAMAPSMLPLSVARRPSSATELASACAHCVGVDEGGRQRERGSYAPILTRRRGTPSRSVSVDFILSQAHGRGEGGRSRSHCGARADMPPPSPRAREREMLEDSDGVTG